MFWMVHKHEPDRNAAVVLKLLILGAGFVAILHPLLSVYKNLERISSGLNQDSPKGLA
jgi:hypothetical protein